MTVEHPVLIPVEGGLIGAVVAEPEAEPRGAAVILPGRKGVRSGPNQIWTRSSRALAGRGVVTLRLDYPGAGDSTEGLDVTASVRRAIAWFLDRAGSARVALVGSCFGARVALQVTDDRVRGMHLIHPVLWRSSARKRGRGRLVGRSRRALRRAAPWLGPPVLPLDPAHEAALRSAASRVPVSVIVGDREAAIATWIALARQTPGLTVDVVEGAAIRAWGSRRAQELIVEGTSDRVAGLFGGVDPIPTPASTRRE